MQKVSVWVSEVGLVGFSMPWEHHRSTGVCTRAHTHTARLCHPQTLSGAMELLPLQGEAAVPSAASLPGVVAVGCSREESGPMDELHQKLP